MLNQDTSRPLYRAVSLAVCISLVLQASPAMAAPYFMSRRRASSGATEASAALPVGDRAAASVARSRPDRAPGPPSERADFGAASTPGAMVEVRPLVVEAEFDPDPVANYDSVADVSASTPALGRASVEEEAAVVAQAPAASIPLVVGWNLVSVPVLPTDTDPAVVLAPIAGKFDIVYAYDNCDASDPWKLYDPDAPAPVNDLTVIDHLIGFWVNMTEAATLDVWGDWPMGPTIPLCSDWNLIGYPLDTGFPVPDALAHISGKYTRLFAYDTTDVDDPWEVYDIDVPAYVNDLQEMTPERGFWIKAIEDVTLLMEEPPPPTVTPVPTDTPEPGPTPTPAGPPPDVTLPGIEEGATITEPTVVTGTITSPTLAEWKLEYRMQNDPTYVEIGSGTTEVVDGELGTFDPTLLLNGIYELRLTAVDESGQTTAVTTNAIVEGNMKVGLFTMSFSDLSIPVSGFPIEIIRTYDSRDKRKGDFGVGWTLDIKSARVQENGDVGLHWKVVRYEGFPYQRWCIEPTKDHVVTVTFSDGRVFKFEPFLEPACEQVMIPDFVTVGFKPISGLTGTAGAELAAVGVRDVKVVREGFAARLLYFSTGEPVDFDRYALELLDGRELVVDQVEGLQSITDLNGNELYVTRNGIVHSSGKAVEFERDAQNRITQITDPMGNRLSYSYDARGDLLQVTDQEGYSTQFTYNADHGLRDVVDPRGVRAARNEYDTEGRLVAVVDPNRRRTDFVHDTMARQEYVRDRLGYLTVYRYDGQGNVVTVTDPLGNETHYEYDGRGNMVLRRDPLGNTDSYSYDALDHRVMGTNAMGEQWTYSYDSMGRLTAVSDPLRRTTRAEYDAVGNLVAVISPSGARTEWQHDSGGRIAAVTDATGASYQLTYDASGNLTGYTDPLGRVAMTTVRPDGRLTRDKFTADGTDLQFEYGYDRAGRLTALTLPSLAKSYVNYHMPGRPSTAVNTLGDSHSLEYDDAGNVSAFVAYDGGRTSFRRDLEGRATAVLLPGGLAVELDRDASGRPTSVRFPNGALFSSTYDSAGRLTSQESTGRCSTRFAYDAADRLTSATNCAGATATYEYDAAGQLVRVTNANGARTEYSYDADGRLASTIVADGDGIRAEYDLAGRLTAIEDQLGARLSFSYDSASQLVSVTDTAGGVTSYSYNDFGVVSEVTTPSGNKWLLEHDVLGNAVARTYPWGGTEEYARDAAGSVIRTTYADGNSVDIAYDSMGRVASTALSSGETVLRTFDVSGRLLSVSGSNGVTSYSYDSAGRTRRITYPDGAYVEYGYAASGRLGTLRTPSGETTYGYDDQGRLTQVIDNDLGVTTYEYDPLGQVKMVHLADGSTTSLTRNNRGMVTRLRTVSADAATAQRDDTIAYDEAGNILLIAGLDGTVVYTYDRASRIASEGPAASDVQEYAYDADWNLTQQGATTLTYDGAMRLVSDGLWTHYEYDAAGRPVIRSNQTLSERFTYDSIGRLRRLERTGATPSRVELTYNHYNLLSRIDVDGVARNLLWDATRPIPALLEERDDSGGLLRRYVYGDGPVGLIDPSSAYVLHRDVTGSVREVSTVAGSPVAEYSYAAYGEQIRGRSDLTSPLRFVGEYLVPELGLYYLRSRFYDPHSGRFLTPDVLEPVKQIPQTYSPYLYAMANPLRYTDPLGTFSLGEVMAVSTIVGILASLALPSVVPAEWVASQLGFDAAWANQFAWQGDYFSGSAGTTLYGANIGAGLKVELLKSAGGILSLDLSIGVNRSSWNPALAAARFDLSTGRSYGSEPASKEGVKAPGSSVGIQFSGSMAQRLISLMSGRNPVGSWFKGGVGIGWPIPPRSFVIQRQAYQISVSIAGGTPFGGRFSGDNMARRLPKRTFGVGIALTANVPLIWFMGCQQDPFSIESLASHPKLFMGPGCSFR